MKLLVTTPIAIAVSSEDVAYVRAEDETGAFGILPGHADFLTMLTVSVVTWRCTDGMEHYVAVAGGVLSVANGDLIEVVTREAVTEDTLPHLRDVVLSQIKEQSELEAGARMSSARLQMAAFRQLEHYLAAGRGTMMLGKSPPPSLRDIDGEP